MINLKEIRDAVRSFDGLTRKKPIEKVSETFEKVRETYGACRADVGDDAAAVDIGGNDLILFAADGIWGKLVEKSPWWAGYAAVLSNVNDIYAMGGRPLAMVDIVSAGSAETMQEIFDGMAAGVLKFGVPVVGGHTHPDPGATSVSIAIIGIVGKDDMIRSDTALPGDAVIMAVDMDGRQGPNSPYSWESTSGKSRGALMKMYETLPTLGKRKLAAAGKDISNPGLIGTLGMLCESSGVGALVDLSAVIRPDDSLNIPLSRWLLVHPGTGFILTAKPEHVGNCCRILENGGLSAAQIGEITAEKTVCIHDGDPARREIVFDLQKDVITGIGKRKVSK